MTFPAYLRHYIDTEDRSALDKRRLALELVRPAARICAAIDCGSRAAEYSRYCRDCCAEIETSNRDAIDRERRRAIRHERAEHAAESALEVWFAVGDWLRATDALNWTLAAILACAVAWIGMQYSEATVAWLKALAGAR